MKKIILFSYLGGPGAIRRTQVNENFRAVRQNRQITSFSYMGPNVKQFAFWAIGGGGLGGP